MTVIYHAQGGLLVRKGRASIDPSSEFDRREALVYGAYKPDATNTGLIPGRTLTVYNGDYTVTTAGAHIQDLHIKGRLIINADNVIVDNCWIRGNNPALTGVDHGLVTVTLPTRAALLRDCFLDPEVPAVRMDGFRWSGYTAKRCRIRWTGSDGFGVFNNTGGDINVSILGCWVENMAKFYPDDGAHSDGSHNDAIQFSGGAHVLVQGNRFEAVIAQDAGNTGGVNTTSTGAAMSPVCYQTNAILQLNSATGPLTDVQILDNWLYGGLIGINGLSTAFDTPSNLVGLVIKRNKFDHNQYFAPSSSGRISIQAAASIDCPTTGADANVYEDTGLPVELRRG